jgi:hypothetical protein
VRAASGTACCLREEAKEPAQERPTSLKMQYDLAARKCLVHLIAIHQLENISARKYIFFPSYSHFVRY